MKSLIELLAKIPLDASSATVQGVEMQVIDHATWQEMLHADPGRQQYHECLMAKCSGILSVNRYFRE